jgi:hypothetical protein
MLLKTELAMPCTNWKLQTRLIVTENAKHQHTRNSLKMINEWRRNFGRVSQIGAWDQNGLLHLPSFLI